MGGPDGSKGAAKQCTEAIRTVGPTLSMAWGGPDGGKEAAKRCTEAIRTVGPTLSMAWGDRTAARGPRSSVPKRSGRWAPR